MKACEGKARLSDSRTEQGFSISPISRLKRRVFLFQE